MAFKQPPAAATLPDSPEKLLLELPRRKIPGVLLHQGETLQAYVGTALNARDVALQLPTGSGKTLVGLLIAEWRRRKFRERVVYLCPTSQLVNQVVEQATDQYGLTVNGFTGPVRDYGPTQRAEYQNADRVAITNYSSLFNTNPFFSDPDIILVDDAHAAENYIAALWTFRVERTRLEHAALHAALTHVIAPHLGSQNAARMLGNWDGIADRAWVDKLATPIFHQIANEIAAVIDVHVGQLDLRYPWQMIRGSLHACHLYVSPLEILIRPLIPPTWTHSPFANARQRIFMSATLGAGGDLERLTGRPSIIRLPVPRGWDVQGIGRRFFIFPDMALNAQQVSSLRLSLMRRAGRSVVLVPSDAARQAIATEVQANLGCRVFDADDIEASKKVFTNERAAVAVIANRYDGIDFPGDECRLFVEGLPKATNIQERFLMSRMGANVLFNERIQTRVLQAIGRCTRSLQDYSAVVVSGEELPAYLADRKRRQYLHPELQAEIEFGVEQSQGTNTNDLLENFDIFLANKREWEQANQQILAKRAQATRTAFPAMTDLEAAAPHEIEYLTRMWQGDFDSALAATQSVLGALQASELKGYRALWHYMAGSAAWLGSRVNACLLLKSRSHFAQAKEAARGIPWLVTLARFQPTTTNEDVEVERSAAVSSQVERIESLLVKLGTLHDREYSQYEKEILEGLMAASRFEQAQVKLGELLGFSVGKVEEDGSPDPWWIADRVCFVFEDKAGTQPTTPVSVKDARQVASHPNWIQQRLSLSADTQIVPILVTPSTKATRGAFPQLQNVALWPLDDFRTWAHHATRVIRDIRKTFTEPGDMVWRAEAAAALESNGMDAPSILARLRTQSAATRLATDEKSNE